MLLASLDKLTKEKSELCDKTDQLLVSHTIVKDNQELSDKTDQLQMYTLKVSSVPWKEISPPATKLKFGKSNKSTYLTG